MNALKEWWQSASGRDQTAVVALGIALAIYILVVGVLRPVGEMAADQKMRVAAQQAAYERVKNLAAQWTQAKQSDGGAGAKTTTERTVENSISQHGLRVAGFDASGRSGIRIRFDRIEYDKFLAWAHDLELLQGIRFKDVSVASGSDAGIVTASVLIQK